MTRAMLIRMILDSAVDGTLEQVNQAIDDYCKEISLEFYERQEGIPPYLMDNSFEHFIHDKNRKP